MKHVFEKSLRIPASAEQVFAWHAAPGALSKLIPPGEPIRILEHSGGIGDGARVVLQIGYPPLAIRWIAIHEGYVEGRQFQDRQRSGPFRFWLHTHSITPLGARACKLLDHVEFELPLSPLSDVVLPLVTRKLKATFKYRYKVTLAAFT